MRVLVTGGLGFIGSSFILYELGKNKDLSITNLDNLSIGSCTKNLESLRGEARYKFVKGDITHAPTVKKLVGEADVVVNFAAETHVDRSVAGPLPFFRSNAMGVLTILEAIRQDDRKVRLVQVSTDEVYGAIETGSFKETDRLAPSSPYASTKAAGDLLCLSYQKTYGLDVAVTRCTNNFGPRQFPEKLLPKSAIRAQLGLRVPIYGGGRNIRDWIYVLDHCRAVDAVMSEGRAGEVYNIAGGNELENIELVETILEALHRPSDLIEYVRDRPGHDFRYSLDDSKIRDELGWKPTHSFKEALESTVKWYADNEDWWRPLADEKVLSPEPWMQKW